MEEEKRWVNMIKKDENEILSLNYRDFATLKVTKKANKLDVVCYVVDIDIFAITEQSIDVYNLSDLENILTSIKKSIEKLYSQIGLFDEDDLDNWINKFVDEINNY